MATSQSQTEHVSKQFIEMLRFARCTVRGQGQGKQRPNQQRASSTPPNAVSNFMQQYRGAVRMQKRIDCGAGVRYCGNVYFEVADRRRADCAARI
jgi:hypothetical protein